jgi:peptide/nickel transport system permease protein
MAAWALVQVVVVLAVAAPLLAFNVPLLMWSEGALSFPIFDSLFHRFLVPNGVDVFFNLLLLVGPLWWWGAKTLAAIRRRSTGGPAWPVAVWGTAFGAWGLLLAAAAATGSWYAGSVVASIGLPGLAVLLAVRWPSRPPTARRLRLGRAGCALVFVAGFLALMSVPPFRYTRAVVDYRARAEALEASGAGWAALPPIPFHPDNVGERGEDSIARTLASPSAQNWLGCDVNGRDVTARLLFGTRISLTIGIVAVSIYVLIGIVLGGLAGYYGRKTDLLISRLIEIVICFPTIFLLLTIIAVFDTRSIFLVMAAIGFIGWTGVARLVRGEFLRQRGLDYVTAAHAAGIPERKIIFRHVLPNCMGPVLVSATFGIAGAILTESGLAFLGLGDTTAASWGQMLTSGRTTGAWHLILVPGFAIFFVVTVFNLLGEGIRDALDPKLRK